MHGSRTARAYARAWFELAVERGCRAAVEHDARAIRDLLADARDLSSFLRDYTVSQARRWDVLKQVFEGRVHELTWRFLCLLERRRRMGRLGPVCETVLDMGRKADGILDGRLLTAVQPDPAWTADVRVRLGRRLAHTVELNTVVCPDLLGGFQVQVADQMLDASVAGALRRLRRGPV